MKREATNGSAMIKRLWSALLESPHVAGARRRFASQIDFVRARLSPRGYLGLQLTVGTLVLLGASWLFGGITEDVLRDDPLAVVDRLVADWFEAHSVPALTRAMLSISQVHNTVPITGVIVALALFLGWKRRWTWLVGLTIVVPGGMLLNVATKEIIARPRPHLRDLAIALSSYSFPSGHAAAATLLYGFVTVYLIAHIRAWRWRVMITLVGFSLIVMVGFSRVYLRLHYLSDVLAGMAESVAWLALCLTAMDTFRRRGRASKFGLFRP
jgi:membrane-associated phospholipid phosphatase